MAKWLKHIFFTVLWVAVVAYVILASVSVRNFRANQVVERVEIDIVDSSAVANLVSRPMVEGWIKKSGVQIVGSKIDSVEMVELERYILSSGFVREVKCYGSLSGVLHIKISQLQPVMRILLDGYNSYITADGYVFTRPVASSRYTPVVTGSYTPLFTAGYNGYLSDLYTAQCQEIEAQIKRVEVKHLYPLYAQRISLREQLREVNKRYTNRRFGESRTSFDERVDELRATNAKQRAELTRALRDLEVKIERERQRQKVYEEREKKLEKKYQDFINLITFVNVVENDKFWSSEIVQLVASESTDERLRLELIPRSGEHTITFGRLDNFTQERLASVKRFYKEVLSSIGWAQFKNINVEYKEQIVCK